jgi:hypothetical protein
MSDPYLCNPCNQWLNFRRFVAEATRLLQLPAVSIVRQPTALNRSEITVPDPMKAKLLVLAALLCSGCQHNYQFDTHPANSTAASPSPSSSVGLKVVGVPNADADPASCCVDPNSPEKKKS